MNAPAIADLHAMGLGQTRPDLAGNMKDNHDIMVWPDPMEASTMQKHDTVDFATS